MNNFSLFVILLQLGISENANILAVLPYKGRSHFIMFEALFKGLAAKGHNVDVVGHFPLKNPMPGYNDIIIKGDGFPTFINNITVESVVNKSPIEDMINIINMCGPKVCRSAFKSETFHELKNTTKKYDVIIAEFFVSDCMLGFSHLLGIPTVVLTTGVTLPWTTSSIGLPDNPAYIPNFITPYTSNMSLYERFINTVLHVVSNIIYDFYSIREVNSISQEFFGPSLPDIRTLIKNVSLLMVNSHFSANIARPAVPNFIEVAGIHIDKKQIALPKQYEDYLKTELKGVIYLSFGSLILTESFPEEKLRGLFAAFKKVPYKVLWKATREKFPKHLEIPSNIQFETWTPQLGILCHPNVKLFVSHGGMMGTLEALHCGVPVLGIPIFADQALNIKTNAAKGLAVHVSYNNVTEESITEALQKILGDPRYDVNAKKASQLFRDRPASALDTAIYWVEYVIRHGGAPHLRTSGADLPWYQYLLIDVITIFLVLLSLLGIILYYLIVSVTTVIFRKKCKTKKE